MLSHNSDMILPRCIARVRRHRHDTRATDTADFLGLCVMRPRDLFVAKRETVHFIFFLCSSLNSFSLVPFLIPTLVSYRLPGNAVRHHIPACPWEWLPGDRWRTEDAYAKDDPRFVTITLTSITTVVIIIIIGLSLQRAIKRTCLPGRRPSLERVCPPRVRARRPGGLVDRFLLRFLSSSRDSTFRQPDNGMGNEWRVMDDGGERGGGGAGAGGGDDSAPERENAPAALDFLPFRFFWVMLESFFLDYRVALGWF